MSAVRVAIAQAEIAPDLETGLEQTQKLARRAAEGGARLVVFPETWLPGYPAWLDSCRDAGIWNHPPVKAEYARMAANSVDVAGDDGRALAGIAREASVTLVVGVVERVVRGPGSGTLYNTLLTYTPDGALANHHRKLMPTYTERLVWGTGDADGLTTVPSPVGRVGGLVCWEHWMPLARQALHDAGEDIHVAAWPTVHEMHQVASRHYAFEGRCFVLAAGSLMRTRSLPAGMEVHEKYRATEWVLRGGSMIVAPDGQVLAGPVFDREEIVCAELDLGRIREESMTLDVSGHYSRADCFDFRAIRHRRPS
ncbi:MAG TPA: carbon-nitrogen hydrolase family protein [Gemmatimonadaceae bacterium]|nr:carbon-nitrogen hydrolase family protein [Gemmatimonadaceae bacterium]